MDSISSAVFRRTYATLTTPVVVTVNGHPIGTYQPISAAIDSRYVAQERPGEPLTPPSVTGHSFNSRPFSPAPKK